MRCFCCGKRYERGHWVCCAPPRGVKSDVWLRRWCSKKPDEDAREGACGRCPRHCTCPGHVRGNLPRPGETEDVRAFVTRLVRDAEKQPREWLPYDDSEKLIRKGHPDAA